MSEALATLVLTKEHNHRSYPFDLTVKTEKGDRRVQATNLGFAIFQNNEEKPYLVRDCLAASLTNLQMALIQVGVEPQKFFEPDKPVKP